MADQAPLPQKKYSTPNSADQFSLKYRGYVLFILTGVYVFNFIDRQILVILQESSKQDLGLSDTQLGLMSGFSFAIFYVSFGIPIARLADKANRRNIIAVSLIIGSGMTAISGRAQNFIQLLLARIGVGIGEAGGSPPAHSIISDLYPPEKRAAAMAVYSTGISIGILVGFLCGGWVNEYFGWRTAFLVVGVLGILYALILRFTVRETPRGLSENIKNTDELPSMKELLRLLWGSRAFRFLALGSGMAAYSQYAISSWLPPFLARIHNMGSGKNRHLAFIDIWYWNRAGLFYGGIFSRSNGEKG